MSMGNIEGEILWLQQWAGRNKCYLETEGEVGFGRECVGIIHGNGYVDLFYDYRDPEHKANWDEMVDLVRAPEGVEHEYHKHECLAVLGRGPERIHELFLWVQNLSRNNIGVTQRSRPPAEHVIELALHGTTYGVLCKL